MRVDVQKLEAVREVIDLPIAEAAIEHGISRVSAALQLADKIGFALRVLPVNGGWIAYAVSRQVWRRALQLAATGATISAAGTELLEREPWHYESESRDDVVMATLCRLLDEGVNVDAGDGTRPVPSGHGLRYASMGAWFEPVKAQWAKFAEAHAAASEKTKA